MRVRRPDCAEHLGIPVESLNSGVQMKTGGKNWRYLADTLLTGTKVLLPSLGEAMATTVIQTGRAELGHQRESVDPCGG